MREDRDLMFLEFADNDELFALAKVLTTDKDGETRWTEGLTISENYKRCYPNNLNGCWEEIADEFQRFGGNTFMNLLRGGGVTYREILIDVAKSQKVNFHKDASLERIEEALQQKVFADSLEKMSTEELVKLIEDTTKTPYKGEVTKQALITAAIHAIKASGFFAYKISVIIANAIARAFTGRGLAFAVNFAITRGLGRAIAAFTNPLVTVIMTLWALNDIAGPAYRVTVPAVLLISYMRRKHQMRVSGEEAEFLASEDISEIDTLSENVEVDHSTTKINPNLLA